MTSTEIVNETLRIIGCDDIPDGEALLIFPLGQEDKNVHIVNIGEPIEGTE